MKISLTSASVFSQSLPAIVVFAFENERLTAPAGFRALWRGLEKKEFHGADGQLCLLHTTGKLPAKRVLLAGLGKQKTFTHDTMRRAAGMAAKELIASGIERGAVQVCGDIAGCCTTEDCLRSIIEGFGLAAYKFTKFKPDNETNHTELKSLMLCLPAKAELKAARQFADGIHTGVDATNYARAIGDLPGNIVYPEILADYARELATTTGLSCTVLDKAALSEQEFGGLLAVGGGSIREPRLIILEHNGGQPSSKPIALVGKAITFDSGGISIKPSDKMDEMKFDKCGGCAVLGAMRAIAELKLPLNVIGIIAAAENMPSATSYRPGDIVTSYKGKEKRGVTIEVLNTDAEGRVVLGDALAYARERNAEAIIDLATLTGACVVALGTTTAGLIGNNEKLQQKIRDAAAVTGEPVWPLPLRQDYRDKIKSHVADIKNTGGREGGTITAAAFLEKYVGDTPWAHLDIAGTAWTTEERPYYARGATGFGVRLLLELLGKWV